jgi:hypothetical protein
MNKSHLNILKKFEELLFKHLKKYVYQFADEIEVKFGSENEQLSWVDIVFINLNNDKKINISFSNGLNYEGKKVNGFRFFISRKDILFSINDYCKFKRIHNPLSENFYFEATEIENKIEIFISECIEFLKIEEINKILFTDFWLDVPPDFSPYK